MKALTVLFAILIIFFLTGCTDKADTPPLSPDQNENNLFKDKAVPFTTTYSGVGYLTQTGPYSASAVIEGNGNASHVGKYTSISNNDLYYTSATAGNIVNGTHTTYSANGDEMYAVYTGTFVIESGFTVNTINFIFNGGTGRFQNLYGEVQLVISTEDVGQLTQDLSGSGSGYIIY